MYVLMHVQNTHVMSTLQMCFLKIGSLALLQFITQSIQLSWNLGKTRIQYKSTLLTWLGKYRII